MRKIVSGLFISVDGVTQAPNEWQGDVWDDAMVAAMSAIMGSQDAMLMGRVTYQEWVGYWPTSTDEPYASYINTMPKYVVSDSLPKVEWTNATLVRGNRLADEIARLKREPGKNIGVAGSSTLVRSLLRQDLLDELVLMVHPVVAGRGRRLFDEWDGLKRLRLASAQGTGKGVAILTYQRSDAA